MSKAITFFRNRQQETGHTYELEIQDSARPYRFFIYARKPLEEALVRTRQLRGGLARDEVEKIKQALQRGEGGVIASTYQDESRQRVLVIRPVAAGDKATFGSFGLLLPGHLSLHLELLSDKGVYLPQGAHALVPVDKEAEDALRGFQDQLGYLPPDLESLVLHAIREPSLDTRMGRLEAVMFDGKGKARGAGVAGSGGSWFQRPKAVWAVAAVVLGLMLAVNSFLLYSILPPDKDEVEADTPVKPDPPNNPDPIIPRIFQTATPERKIFDVVEAVRSKRNSDPRLDSLWRSHFSKVQKEEDVAVVLAQQTDGRLLVRGLLKLEALRPDAGSVQEDFFEDPQNWTDLNKFYERRSLEERERLAALVCAAFGKPELPERPGRAAAVPFSRANQVNQDCKETFPLEKAASGLDELLNLVQEAN